MSPSSSAALQHSSARLHERLMSVKPGIILDPQRRSRMGDKAVPCVRFLGQTSNIEGLTHPEIDVDGEFTWQGKSGDKSYVY